MNEPTRHRQESKRVAVKHSQQKNPLTSILSNNSQILNRYEVEEMECTRSEKNHTVVVCAPKIVCAPLYRFRFAVEIYSCCCWLVRFCKGCLLRTEGGYTRGASGECGSKCAMFIISGFLCCFFRFALVCCVTCIETSLLQVINKFTRFLCP